MSAGLEPSRWALLLRTRADTITSTYQRRDPSLVSFRRDNNVSVVVIGLGRFGTAVAQSLVGMGQEVLAVDENPQLVERWADEFTHVVRADSTDDEALRQLGVADFD